MTPSPIQRKAYDSVAGDINRFDYLGTYCEDLVNALNLKAVREAGVHIGADPMGGASVQYWGYIAENLGIDLTVINPEVDPRFVVHDPRHRRQDQDGLLLAERHGLVDHATRMPTTSRPGTTPIPTGMAS